MTNQKGISHLTPPPPHLLQHLVLLVEELHFDVSTDRKWLWKLKQHQFVFPPGVGGVGCVDLHLQLVHDKLRVCRRTQTPVNSRSFARSNIKPDQTLTAGASSKHGDGFKQHLMEEQSDRFVLQLVL